MVATYKLLLEAYHEGQHYQYQTPNGPNFCKTNCKNDPYGGKFHGRAKSFMKIDTGP